MATIAEFTDPLLIAVYDAVNAYDADAQPGFYSELAGELGARSIIDLGCGTGLISRALAAQGYQVTGIDPASGMVELGRRRPGGDMVKWIIGDASQLDDSAADLAIMTGHVAQFFLTDEAWDSALTALHRALGPAGHLAFETRNPAAREWESWTTSTRSTVTDPLAGQIEVWSELEGVHGQIVSYTNHYVFASGEHLASPNQLRFRTEEQLVSSLENAGFVLEHLYGDWDRRPFTPAARELIVVACGK